MSFFDRSPNKEMREWKAYSVRFRRPNSWMAKLFGSHFIDCTTIRGACLKEACVELIKKKWLTEDLAMIKIMDKEVSLNYRGSWEKEYQNTNKWTVCFTQDFMGSGDLETYCSYSPLEAGSAKEVLKILLMHKGFNEKDRAIRIMET